MAWELFRCGKGLPPIPSPYLAGACSSERRFPTVYSVVRGFSLEPETHNPEGSHYIIIGKEEENYWGIPMPGRFFGIRLETGSRCFEKRGRHFGACPFRFTELYSLARSPTAPHKYGRPSYHGQSQSNPGHQERHFIHRISLAAYWGRRW